MHSARHPLEAAAGSTSPPYDPFVRKAPVFVVPVDFSSAMEGAASTAIALARQCGAAIDLIEVVPSRGPSHLDPEPQARLGGRIRSRSDWSRLEGSIHAAERAGIRVRTVTYRGDAIKLITAYVQLVKAKLIVIGRHYSTSQWRRNTRVVSTLSRTGPAPVLVLPPQYGSDANKPLSFAHVVSAVDFTVASAVAVRMVKDLIRGSGARLTLVHALRHEPGHMVFSGGEALRVARNVKGRAAQIAAHLRKKIPASARIRVDARVTTGAPHRGILAIASEVNADLLVMGVPPRSRIDEVLFGSTLRFVLRHAKTPVLVVPVLAGAYTWLDENDGLTAEAARASAMTPATAARRQRSKPAISK
jgi:nucleotide-binding universal stress UspA family protein